MTEEFKVIRTVLSAKDITVTDLSKAMGISRTRTQIIMNRASTEDLKRIADASDNIEIKRAAESKTAVVYAGTFMDMYESIRRTMKS